MKFTRLAHVPVAMALFSCSGTDATTTSTSGAGTAAPAPAAPSATPAATPAAAASAGSTSAAAPVSAAPTPSTSALQMPPLEPGFQRFIAPAVPVPTGTTDDWLQWVAGPTDQDYDVIELKGAQSKGGHHALMLSIGEPNMPGTTRKYTERDQLTSSSVGGIGAEGNVAIPEGVVFRLHKGSYLAIQSHYLNTTDQDIQGETYIDIKMTPSDPNNTVAGHFASTSLKISLAPKLQTMQDVYCDIAEDVPILRMTNHMHYAGVSTFTEYTDPAGVTHMLKKDDTWNPDWSLTPNYDNYAVSEPLVLPAGSKLHTQCTWNNDTDKQLTFPEEMCVFATIILGEREISCIDGKFVARDPSAAPMQPAAAGAAAPAPAAGASAAGASAAGASGGLAAAAGACSDDANRAVVGGAPFEEAQRLCARMCLGLDDSCATDCLVKNSTLTPECAACEGAKLGCAMTNCIADCTDGFASASCMPCLETNCGAAYHSCSGL
jgi:hypothetical protein